MKYMDSWVKRQRVRRPQSDPAVAIHKTRRNAASPGLLPFTLSLLGSLLAIIPRYCSGHKTCIAIPKLNSGHAEPWTRINSKGERR